MKYVFHLPNYVPYSNGIKSLWYAAYLFSKNREVYVHPYNGGEIEKYEAPINYKKLINKNKVIERDDIVVYPDMVKGNPLNAKRVARYLMAKPYILNGEGVEKGESDFLFSFSYAVDRNLPQLNTLLPELKKLAKYKVDNKNKKVVIYYGKCRISLAKTAIKEIIKDFECIKIVTRTIPSNKEILYKEIAEASLFISFDPLSSLAYEANLVGTPTLLMDDVFSEDFKNFNQKMYGFYYSYDALKKQDLELLGQKIYNKSHCELDNVLEKMRSKFEELY